jgi:hypothetical protein
MYGYSEKMIRTAAGEPAARPTRYGELRRQVVPLVRRTIRRGFAVSPFERLVLTVIDEVSHRHADGVPRTDAAYFDAVLDGVCTQLIRTAPCRPAPSTMARETVLA